MYSPFKQFLPLKNSFVYVPVDNKTDWPQFFKRELTTSFIKAGKSMKPSNEPSRFFVFVSII